MTPTKLLRPFLLACFALGCAPFAQADLVLTPTFSASASNTAPSGDTSDYEGVFYDGVSTFPPASISIGTFSFTIPAGESVAGATISGTFGDVNIPTTTLTDLYVDGIDVAGCDSFDADCATGDNYPSLVSWSHTFTGSELTSLASDFSAGTLDFTAVQNFPFGEIVVGTPVLTIDAVPEPGSILTLATVLAFAALGLRKKLSLKR